MAVTDKAPAQAVMVCGKKKSATAIAHCKKGKGMIRVNGRPLTNLTPEHIRVKVMEPLLVLGVNRFMNVDIRVRVKGGGFVSQVYAIRQALSKAIVAYYHKFEDESTKAELREMLIRHDRSLLVADPRRCEAKKFGGPSARTRRQKSYR